MKNISLYHVKKRSLLALAGMVWIIAGINVSRMGIVSYILLNTISLLYFLLSLVVFAAFGTMFYKISLKHSKRIQKYEDPVKPFWYFFGVKDYVMMIVMMSGGIWLRTSKMVSIEFIAVFYTGLGLALTLAGISFWIRYFQYTE